MMLPVVNAPPVAVSVTLPVASVTWPSSVRSPAAEMERSPTAVAAATVSDVLLSRNSPPPAVAVKVGVPREVVFSGLPAAPIPPVAVRTNLFADTVASPTFTIAPLSALRVTVPGAETLFKTTPAVLLIGLARLMFPFQFTLMFPANVVALRVNGLLGEVPFVT